MISEKESREEVVAEARSWFGTPYHKRGRIKGVGADCFTFIAEVMISKGLFGRDELPAYSDDWFANVTEEEYLKLLFRHTRKMLQAVGYERPLQKEFFLPGNIVTMVSHNSKINNHGGIILAWPKIAHCIYDGVEEVNASRDPMWSYKPLTIFDPWKKGAA